METTFGTVLDFMSTYGIIYLKIQAIYQLIHQFLMGVVGNQWGSNSVIAGVFFPFSLFNELGFLVGLILSYITKRGIFEREPDYPTAGNEHVNKSTVHNNPAHNTNSPNSEESLRFGPEELEREYGRRK